MKADGTERRSILGMNVTPLAGKVFIVRVFVCFKMAKFTMSKLRYTVRDSRVVALI